MPLTKPREPRRTGLAHTMRRGRAGCSDRIGVPEGTRSPVSEPGHKVTGFLTELLSTEPWLKPCRAPSKPTPHGSQPWKGWVDPPLLFPSLTPLGYTIFGPCGKTHYFSSLLGTECGFTTPPEGTCSCRLPCSWGGGGPHQKWPQNPAPKWNPFL